MNKLNLLRGDTVRYQGTRSPDIRGKIGVVVAPVDNCLPTDPKLVVEFGGEAYIVSPNDVVRQSHAGGGSGDDYMAHVERKWRTSDEKKGGKKGKDKQ